MNTGKVLKFLEHFSVITVGDSKLPNFSWKEQQSQKLTPEKLTYRYEYKGGKFYTDETGEKKEIQPTVGFGLVTGFEHLEVLDIDLKVFSTAKEKIDFWNEFLGYLQDNILDFEDKFTVYKTKKEGYHLLYKTKRVEGNKKLAKLKGHKEAVIETRGIGGYVFVYPENKVFKKSYFEIDYISDDDREILFSFSRMYDYKEEITIEKTLKKSNKEFSNIGLTPWEDYNNKTDIFDVISSDFTIVKNLSKKIVIKRHNAESPHSGYVFKDTGFMFLFSTGTIYPHEKLITPFLAYSYKYHNGDFSEAARDIYKKGYGERIVIKEHEPKEKIKLNENDLIFPIDIFPNSIQAYISDCNKTLDSSIDFMGCSLLWLISLSVGNSAYVEVKRGWKENGTVWIAVVGKAGIGKTPSISNIVFPLEKINNREIQEYISKYEKYEYYSNLSKKEKEEHQEIDKPKKTQFIVNDVTIEALVDLHQQSDNSVGVFKDELAGWFKDFNKYKQGSDLEFWLSTWSGKSINVNRITRAGSFVSNPFIPVIGGIQPSILNNFFTEENKDNGFVDRMLLCYPDLKVEYYNDNEMDFDVIQWFSDTIMAFFDTIRNKYIERDQEGKILTKILRFSQEAKLEWKRIFNDITTIQNDENENEYMKSMLPKQKSYIPRFSLLIHLFNSIGEHNYNLTEISKESILKAEKLSKYFIAMAKKIKIDSIEVQEIKQVIRENKGKNTKEQFIELYKRNPSLNKKEVSEQLGVSVQMIYRYLKDLDNGVKI